MFLSCWTCCLMMFTGIVTSTLGGFFSWLYSYWSIDISECSQKFLFGPRKCFLKVVLRVFYPRFLFQRKQASSNTLAWFSPNTGGSSCQPAIWMMNFKRSPYNSANEFIRLQKSFKTFPHTVASSLTAEKINIQRPQQWSGCRSESIEENLFNDCNIMARGCSVQG